MNWRVGTPTEINSNGLFWAVLLFKDGKRRGAMWDGLWYCSGSPVKDEQIEAWLPLSEIPGPDSSTETEIYQIYEASGQPAIFPRGGFERWPAGSKVVVSRVVPETEPVVKWEAYRWDLFIDDRFELRCEKAIETWYWTVRDYRRRGGLLDLPEKRASGSSNDLSEAQSQALAAAQALMEGKDRD